VRRAAPWVLVAPWAAWALGRLLGLDRGFPLVPLAAYTPYAAAAALVSAAIVAFVLRRFTATLVAVAAAGVLVALVIPRVHADPAPDAGAAAGPRLRVLEINAAFGLVPPKSVVDAVRREHVDVLVVTELTPELDRGLAAAGLGRVMPHRVSHPAGDASGTGLYARRALAPRAAPRTSASSAAALLSVPGAPPAEIYAVHPESPTTPASVATWRRDLRALPRAASPGALRILIGDFNATLDHHELRRLIDTGYEDAGEEAGKGLEPTWPAGKRVPAMITIDHVLADVRCGVAGYRTVSFPITDHKGVLTTLVLPRGP
jgi:endonuclease/exonuclease/phosphatase (EEP) superfamily protein YafD